MPIDRNEHLRLRELHLAPATEKKRMLSLMGADYPRPSWEAAKGRLKNESR